MNLPRRLRSFSLRTLLVLVGICSLAAWWWADHRYGPERRLQAALTVIRQENPRVKAILYRGDGYCEILARDIELVSSKAARLISSAKLVRLIRLRAANEDGLLREIRLDQDGVEALQEGFAYVLDGSIEIKCVRSASDAQLRREDFHEWDRGIWNDWRGSDAHLMEIQRPLSP